jgi:GNAT superfamily N-acetyltransferase
MSLRPGTVDDVAAIGELIRGLADYEQMSDDVLWTVDELRDSLFGEHSQTKVTLAIHDDTGEVAGFALWFQTFSTFRGDHGIYLEDLFVRPEFRGHGYGLALLQDLRARTTGRVEWTVLDWNQSVIEFYEALGAEQVSGWTRFRWLP